MSNRQNHNGFSLTEVLLAVGTLAIGMVFIGGTYLAGIHFATLATERTVAAVAADEAFAKIRIFGVNLASLLTGQQTPYRGINPKEFAYPSTRANPDQKQYYWSALCRLTEPVTLLNRNPPIQVTVFVSRKVGSGAVYRGWAGKWPVPVEVNVSAAGGNILQIESGKESWINDGYKIVDDSTGQIYRVLKRDPEVPDTIELDRPWQGGNSVWVVPPAVGGGRYPCIAVYQRVSRF